MREMVIYEQELDHVGLLNTLSAAFISASSSSLLFGVGVIVNGVMQDDVSQKAWGLIWTAVPVALLLSGGFGVAAFLTLRSKGSKVRAMKEAAIEIDQSVPVAPMLAQPSLTPMFVTYDGSIVAAQPDSDSESSDEPKVE